MASDCCGGGCCPCRAGPEGNSVPVSRVADAWLAEWSSCLTPPLPLARALPALFWFATGLACGDFSDFVSAIGGIDGDRDRGVSTDSARNGIVGDRDLDFCEPAAALAVTVSYDFDFDDEARSEEQPDAKASGGATCRGLCLSADLKGPVSYCALSLRFAMPAGMPVGGL